ncbi:MAG: GDSL-type esterase/lipase family protein [Peptococcaceae bacterium]|nr:GDSL-type esterase/lipase family protein [Peptococcaceae bacterium]
MKDLICALGDSLTWGYPFGPEYSWARSLGPVRVKNFGRNGDTLGDMLLRTEQALAPKPLYLLVMGGANDLYCRRSRPQMETDLLAIAGQAEAEGARPVLGLCPPVLDESEGGLARWRDRQKELAAIKDWPVIDFFSCLSDAKGEPRRELFWDECHLTKEGYGEMRRCFVKSIGKLVPSLIDFSGRY